MLGGGPSADNPLGSTHGRFGCVVSSLSAQPRNQETVRDMRVSHFRLNSPSSVAIVPNDRPDG